MPPEDPLDQIEDLARLAEAHARERHEAALGADQVERADEILRAETGGGDPGRIETLAALYGAWLGRLAVLRGWAVWVGLSEPAPPRLRAGGVLASPIDAVRRRLTDPSSPSVGAVLRQIEAWSNEGRSARAAALRANQSAWDSLAGDPRFAGELELPPDDRSAQAALDPWIREEGVRGKRLLCLGAGGGRHGPLHALAGAHVTVVDFSDSQLELDRRLAAKRGLSLRTARMSIDRLEELESRSFDLVLQPVSACYLPEVTPIYAGVARVLRPGGLYVVQHKAPAAQQADLRYLLTRPSSDGVPVPGEEAGTREFIHTLDSLLGGLCRAGFLIEDLVEPPRADALAPAGSPGHRAWFLPPYLKIKARRRP